MSLLDLRRRRGDPWDAAAWNTHLEEIGRYLETLGVTTAGGRVRRTSQGTVYLPISADAGNSTSAWLVRVGYGLLGGVEPKIKDRRVSEVDPATGDTPTFVVGAGDFSAAPDQSGDWPKGVCFIYGVAKFDSSWGLTGAEIVARSTPWTATPWKAGRLIGLLQRDDPDDEGSDVTVRQLTVFNQALTLSRKSGNGTARYWWRATV